MGKLVDGALFEHPEDEVFGTRFIGLDVKRLETLPDRNVNYIVRSTCPRGTVKYEHVGQCPAVDIPVEPTLQCTPPFCAREVPSKRVKPKPRALANNSIHVEPYLRISPLVPSLQAVFELCRRKRPAIEHSKKIPL
jgi:hypothetical protein